MFIVTSLIVSALGLVFDVHFSIISWPRLDIYRQSSFRSRAGVHRLPGSVRHDASRRGAALLHPLLLHAHLSGHRQPGA